MHGSHATRAWFEQTDTHKPADEGRARNIKTTRSKPILEGVSPLLLATLAWSFGLKVPLHVVGPLAIGESALAARCARWVARAEGATTCSSALVGKTAIAPARNRKRWFRGLLRALTRAWRRCNGRTTCSFQNMEVVPPSRWRAKARLGRARAAKMYPKVHFWSRKGGCLA